MRRLDRLRPYRALRERDAETASAFKAVAREQKRAAKALAGIADVFEASVPAELSRACSLAGMRGGLLTIETRSSSVRFALDRHLRNGGEAALATRFAEVGIPVLRVRVVCTAEP